MIAVAALIMIDDFFLLLADCRQPSSIDFYPQGVDLGIYYVSHPRAIAVWTTAHVAVDGAKHEKGQHQPKNTDTDDTD